MSLAELQPEESSVIPALLTALERWTSDFPDEVRAGAETDLSLYDRRRTAAAFGSCLSEYLLAQKDSGFQEATLRKKETFLLYTAGFSGIQKWPWQRTAGCSAVPRRRAMPFASPEDGGG